MAYIHIGDDSLPLGLSGCGPNCPCAPCRQHHAHLSEWYVKEDNSDSEPGRTGEWNLIGGLRRRRRNNMYIPIGEGLGQDQATAQPCDKIETATLRVPFRDNVDDFLKLVCCAIGRWMIFRTDQPAGRQAWCFVKKNETLLRSVHDKMSASKFPCVELQAQYCRRRGATIDVTITKWKSLPTACRPSSLCKPGVCNPSVACPPTPPKPQPPPPPTLDQCRKEKGFVVCKKPCVQGFWCNGSFCEPAPGAADPSRPNECWYIPILATKPAAKVGGWGGFGQPMRLPPTTPAPRRGFDPAKAAKEAAEKIVPLRPETPEERLQRILKEPVPTLPPGRSFKEWLDRKLADRRIPKWLRDRIWKSFFDKNWGLLSNLLNTAGFSGGTKASIIETARAAGEVKAR
jgi:hypothetical protein